ncbi:hypothetical protein [Arthrobacter sp. NPDC092385]|uniref:hypothetical protein n=1 Tax=Arthrobacter sp. NPDC092385 TaxID=3363943 RepID=UPI0037FEEFEC
MNIQPVQPIQQVGPSILPPAVPELAPEVVVEEVQPPDEPAAEVPPTETATVKASPSASPSVTPRATPAASATATPEAVALEPVDSQQGPNVPLLAVLSVVIIGCLAGLAKVVGIPGSLTAHSREGQHFRKGR